MKILKVKSFKKEDLKVNKNKNPKINTSIKVKEKKEK